MVCEIKKNWKTGKLYLLVGYVDALKKLLFSLGKVEREKIYNRYCSMVPGTLTEQYENRLSKEEAVKAHKKKFSMINTQLFPAGNVNYYY